MPDVYHPIRRLAKAIRLGDITAANLVLDGFTDSWSDEVTFGRADAAHEVGRDPPLPQLACDPLPGIEIEKLASFGRHPSRGRRRAA